MISDVDINKTSVSNKVSFGKKVSNISLVTKLITKTRPFMLPKMSAYIRDFEETKYISFSIKNEELLEKYNEIWDKISNTIKKGLNSQLDTMKNI